MTWPSPTVKPVTWADLVHRARLAPPAVVELAVLVAVAVPTAMDAWWNEAGTRQADGLTYVLTVVSIGALTFRRRWPFATALTCGAALTGWYLLGHYGELLILPTMVALYGIAVRTDRRTIVVTGVVASAWSGILGFTSSDPIGARGGSPVLEMLWPLVPLALGEATRSRYELLAVARAEREREALRQVEAERVRIARDFHDLVAHTMAAVNVHLGVAVAAFDTDPAAARTALTQARATSKQAFHDLRDTVALLRDPTVAASTQPAPRLADLDRLVDAARATGIAVTLDTATPATTTPMRATDDGVMRTTDDGVPAATELAAYRIVQEALTNVIRHSGARHATVALRRPTGQLVVEITDDGNGANNSTGNNNGSNNGNGSTAPGTPPTGHGLVGMTERAVAVGGRLEHGPTGLGGFRVRAVLPVPTVPA
jgi:signal transduction histidine kinase